MNAKKCDICGKFYEEGIFKSPSVRYSIMRVSIAGIRMLDLCPDCHEDLKKYAEGDRYDESGSGGNP